MNNATSDQSELEHAIAAAAEGFPQATAVMQEIVAMSPALMRAQLTFLIRERSPKFWEMAERLVGLSLSMNGSPAKALLEYTIVYLKEQVRFLKSGQYAHTDFEDALQKVYSNPDVMEKFYLEGLMLTHAFWPIHFDIHTFFTEEFVSRIPDEGVGAEFGFGHGLYLLDILTARKGTYAKGFDISEFSKKYAGELLRRSGVPEERYSLAIADVRTPLPAQNDEFRWTIFAEILEHIPDPRYSLGEVNRCLAAGAPLFMTTVVNSNAIDHLWQFNSVDEVDSMIADAGFEIIAKKVLAVADYGSGAQDPTIDVAYVCQPTS